MRVWHPLPGEERVLYSPVGLRLVDDLTGGPPVSPVEAFLELQDGPEWRPVERQARITASSILGYPGLGRGIDAGGPPRRYRVRLEARFYRAGYRAADDGIEFDVAPYDDATPPVPVVSTAVTTALLPAAAYPFAPHLPVLRGVVVDAAAQPVADVLVQEGMRERVLSDERGAFSLPLRWVAAGVSTTIDATDQRTGRTGSINVTLPGALAASQTITVS